MRLRRTRDIVFASALVFAIPAFAKDSEPPVQVNTDGMALHVAAKVKAKAAQGITALRRYVYITRAMHQIDLRSIVIERRDEDRR